ncbi:uncharacterized protein LOC141591932 [Silene latifolia]|uniref:uncharacterized protein LOC141591932 n=1 Tax=Silene latifolia TaxID=37657 RepID=UPI003D76AC2A
MYFFLAPIFSFGSTCLAGFHYILNEHAPWKFLEDQCQCFSKKIIPCSIMFIYIHRAIFLLSCSLKWHGRMSQIYAYWRICSCFQEGRAFSVGWNNELGGLLALRLILVATNSLILQRYDSKKQGTHEFLQGTMSFSPQATSLTLQATSKNIVLQYAS